jgi:transcriptional regulator with XRE-family HTH domain
VVKNNLRRIRKLKGVTQDQLAQYLGVSKQMISMWENNPKEKIPESRITQIADFIRVRAEDIVSEDLDELRIEADALTDKISNIKQELKTVVDREEREELLIQAQVLQNEVQALGDLAEWEGLNVQLVSEIKALGFDSKCMAQIVRFSRVINSYRKGSDPLLIEFNNILALLEEENMSKFKFLITVVETLIGLTNNNGSWLLKDDPYAEWDEVHKKTSVVFKEFVNQQR